MLIFPIDKPLNIVQYSMLVYNIIVDTRSTYPHHARDIPKRDRHIYTYVHTHITRIDPRLESSLYMLAIVQYVCLMWTNFHGCGILLTSV